MAISSLAAYYWCKKASDGLILLKLTVLFLPSIVGFFALFTDLKKDGQLTRWGYAAVLLGFEAAALGCVVQLVEQARQNESTAQSIDRQTKMIASLRELLSPINDEIKVDLVFKIPANQGNLEGLALELENQNSGLARYIELSRISSRSLDERQLAQFLDEDFLLFYCKEESCMDS
ncbi:MAG: hypothetical protein ACRD51_06830 [Candidatus Acidiferrum sp.]